MFINNSTNNLSFVGKYNDINTKDRLIRYLVENLPIDKKIVILCVGSDRSTGDSLGPLVGSFLSNDRYFLNKDIEILGTLDKPLHAKNINKVIKKIKQNDKNICTIVVDACLDSYEDVGNIRVINGSIYPNSWSKKNILKIGDFYVNMVVNVGGFKEFKVLQSTKLSFVIKGADLIADSISEALHFLKSKSNF